MKRALLAAAVAAVLFVGCSVTVVGGMFEAGQTTAAAAQAPGTCTVAGQGAALAASAAKAAGFPADQLVTAVAVAGAESGWRPAAVGAPNSNGTSDYGLWQINSIHNPTAYDWADPLVNARLALKVWQGARWQAWVTFNSGAYTARLAEAQAAVAGHTGVCTPQPTGDVATMVRTALTQVGDPYVWGAEGPDAFDCSGLVVYSWYHAGRQMRVRTARDMFAVSQVVPRGQERTGDLGFSNMNQYGPARPGHVWVVVVPGTAVEASQPGAPVAQRPYNAASEGVVFGRLTPAAFR